MTNNIEAEAKEYADKIMLGGCLNEHDNPAYSIERNAIMAHYIAGASRTITPESGIETTSYLMGVEDGKELAKKQLSELSNTSTIEREGLKAKFLNSYSAGLTQYVEHAEKIFDWFAPYLKDTEGWISVEERLPENDCRILSYTKMDSGNFIALTDIEFRVKDKVFERYMRGDDYSKWIDVSKSVTHWMPLPSPPINKHNP